MPRRLLVSLAAVMLLLGVTIHTAGPAYAGTGLFYQAVDSDNDPYSGIYLRNGTSMGNVDRVYSRYLYYGNTVELICGTWGESVGPNANRRWHLVLATNGPATGQQGWIADRYLNTPNIANQPTPGEPECGAPPPPPPPSELGAVYYSPYDLGSFMPDSMASVVGKSYWQGTGCSDSMNKVAAVTPTWNANTAKTVTAIAGWSLGRLGPIYYLKSHPERWATINYVVMIDPGSYDQLRTSCDANSAINANQVLKQWLEANPNARLVVFAGTKTADVATATGPQGQYAHRGIQEIWFRDLRDSNSSARNRVMVCNYQSGQNPTNELHQDMFQDFDEFIDQPPSILGSCPAGGVYWHP
jgi:hypothetical protein